MASDQEQNERSNLPRHGASGSSSRAPPPNANTPSASSARSTRSNTKAKSSNIVTMADLQRDDESDDDRQALYAGGEKSGVAVEGPGKPGSDLVAAILKKAAERGPPPQEKKPTKKQFNSPGHRLGDTSTVRAPEPIQEPPEEQEPIVRHLTFWRNGFSIEDGPLYRYDDPANQGYLAAINSGRAPLSLLDVGENQPVDVKVAKRMDEDYVPPPKVQRAFEGQGRRLGDPSPSSQPIPGAFPTSSNEATSALQLDNLTAPKIDESQKKTKLQIRVAGVPRPLTVHFNVTHTVGDIYTYLSDALPGREFILQVPYPRKDLVDREQTLEEAKLENAALVLRFT